MKDWISSANAPYIEALYESYLQDPHQVSEEWRKFFSHEAPEREIEFGKKQVSVLQLINAYRFLGLRHADLDPLKHQEPAETPELDPAHYGLDESDMGRMFNCGSLVGPARATLREILAALKTTYCGKIGAEYMYLSDNRQKRWIQARLEGRRATPDFSAEYKKQILERLTEAETLEKYLHTKYVGQKRFSLEGADSLIPLLDNLLQRAGAKSIREVVIGMAHRGRLTVLVNILGKMPTDLFSEFEGKKAGNLSAGDVKYHQGFSSDIQTETGPMHVTLAFNPSHLEIVDPVVEGSVRARQHRRADNHGRQVIPLLIHGDAAFAAQGVVMETMNLSQTRGFKTGGTVHVVVNNQIGFTTSDPRDTRSTIYCSDVAKMIEAPIFHVNADDPEALLMISEIALDFRMEFQKDVVIDMVCFRRHGHNEQDEPLVTQPAMYQLINQHPGTRALYAQKLLQEGVLKEGEAEEMISRFHEAMDRGEHPNKNFLRGVKHKFAVDWTRFKNAKWDADYPAALPIEELRFLSERVTVVPEGFRLHSRVEKIIEARKMMGKGELPLDWGMAETLAYATLLKSGYPVRISGQDVGRGTFFHRHAVIHNQNPHERNGGTHVPLQHVLDGQPDFIVIDAVLSEEAVLGFEYGYATAEPDELVIWEAQFGDFANVAQVVIDQFIASGEAKWGRLCGLTLMLPHGYEGQGPEHSSARIERYLQLCADDNIQVCIPSTPAQMYHLLRRQMLRPYRKPLVVMSPKSLLRHKDSVSSLQELAEGRFMNVIGERELEPAGVKKVVACSGKIYYDLIAARTARKDIAIVRIEQLYPFPRAEFKKELSRYPEAREILWCQEEPGNQGAWFYLQNILRECLVKKQKLHAATRPDSASPAVGNFALHTEQQKNLINAALG